MSSSKCQGVKSFVLSNLPTLMWYNSNFFPVSQWAVWQTETDEYHFWSLCLGLCHSYSPFQWWSFGVLCPFLTHHCINATISSIFIHNGKSTGKCCFILYYTPLMSCLFSCSSMNFAKQLKDIQIPTVPCDHFVLFAIGGNCHLLLLHRKIPQASCRTSKRTSRKSHGCSRDDANGNTTFP